MKTSMTFPIRFWATLLAALLIYQFSTDTAADWCKYEKEIDLTLDLSDSDVLAITAAAGDLEVRGVSGSDNAVIKGKVCVSKQAWLDKAEIETTPGKRAQINVNLPESNGGWSLFGSNYATLDLEIELPQDIALDVRDSSGDATFRNIAAMELQDSSGNIEIEGTTGPVSIKDSSGDIEIENVGGALSIRDSSGDIDIDQVAGDFTIEADSSGDIRARDIDGTVLVKKDSSGDIRVTQVTHDVIVEIDSSGDISVKEVGGDFRVLTDGSGAIRSQDVQGETQTPKDS
jgi:Toastrack DUF4097